jgi:hypothetical protein
MKSPHRFDVLLLALVIAAGAPSGCAGSKSGAANLTGSGGSSGIGCQTSACVPAIATHVTWAIEIDPPGSAAAALTELPAQDVGPAPLVLYSVSQVAVDATFTGGASSPVPATANVVLTVPPLIGGRPDLSFEVAAESDKASGTTSGSLELPAGRIGGMGTLQLVPLSPADQQSPPAAFAVQVAAAIAEPLPMSYAAIGGTLVSSLGTAPTATFVARAFQGGTQISNAPLSGSDGTFQLLLAPIQAGTSVIVELTPQNQGGPDPWYTSTAVLPGANLGTIMLPAYSNPNVFTLPVVGADDPTAAVSGAFVRAQAILFSSAAGATDFLRAGTTSANGTVPLSLIPGTATTLLDYDLTVIPPASSPYATRCIMAVGVSVGGTATAPVTLPAVALPRRPVLTGTVTNSLGIPVPYVAVAATAGPAPTGGCSSTPAVSSNIIADENGHFSLPLDPGNDVDHPAVYQLDYDPPAGSSAPRLTEVAVMVPPGVAEFERDVTLPTGALVQGTVYAPGSGGLPLPSATVRIFEVRCSGQDDCFGPARTPPWLRGQTATDANGSFRVVVPAPAAGN